MRTRIIYAAPRANEQDVVVTGGSYPTRIANVEDKELFEEARRYIGRQNRLLARKCSPWRVSLADIELKFVLPRKA